MIEHSFLNLESAINRILIGCKKLLKHRLSVFGLIFIGISVFIALSAPILAPYKPLETQVGEMGPVILEGPSRSHILGTTHLGRDVFTQWMYGARAPIIVGLLSGVSVMLIGTIVGIVSGYYRGTVDLVLMRLVDILYGIPAVPLVLVIAMFLGSSLWIIIGAFITIMWRTMARLVRAQTLSLRERPYIKSAKASGASDFRIMFIHILPNLVPIILIEGTFMIGTAIILEAGISFLGLGATEDMSWGAMLQTTFQSGAIDAWWWIIPPGVSISLLVLSFFYISRGIEEVTNPEINR